MTVPENPPDRSFVWPADYYASPTPASVLPRWATFGCAAAAIVVLVIVFAGGAFLSSGGLTGFMDFAIGMSVAEMKGQYAADLSEAQKKSLDEEIGKVRKNLRAEAIPVTALQPFLEKLREAGSDTKISTEEARGLEETARKINASAKPAKRVKG